MGFGMSRERYLPLPESQILFPFCFVETLLTYAAGGKVPNPKNQAPKKFQWLKFRKAKTCARLFRSRNLELPWDLELGIWSFQRVKLLEHFLRMKNVPTMKPRVVIVGAGFGGLEAAKKLACQDVDLTVIDRTNYHLFQPLLYQVATAALSPADIAAPVRGVLRKCKNVEVILADVQSVNVNLKKVNIGDRDIDYDFLILATGARHSVLRASGMGKARAGSEKFGRRDRNSTPNFDGV